MGKYKGTTIVFLRRFLGQLGEAKEQALRERLTPEELELYESSQSISWLEAGTAAAVDSSAAGIVVGAIVGLGISATFGATVLVVGAAGYACGVAYDIALRRRWYRHVAEVLDPARTIAQRVALNLGVDGDRCPKCHSQMVLLALITAKATVSRILDHLGIPSTPPPIAPARDPNDQLDLLQADHELDDVSTAHDRASPARRWSACSRAPP